MHQSTNFASNLILWYLLVHHCRLVTLHTISPIPAKIVGKLGELESKVFFCKFVLNLKFCWPRKGKRGFSFLVVVFLFKKILREI